MLHDVLLHIDVPLIVTVDADSEEDARNKAEEGFYEGYFSEKLFMAIREDPGDEVAIASWAKPCSE